MAFHFEFDVHSAWGMGKDWQCTFATKTQHNQNAAFFWCTKMNPMKKKLHCQMHMEIPRQQNGT